MVPRLMLIAAVAMVASPTLAEAGPSDAEIAHIAYTAGNLDVETAKLALTKSNSPTVRDFAQVMVRDHQAVNDKALALLNKLGVIPQPNATSAALTKQAAETRQRLAALEGAAFDKAYSTNEAAIMRRSTRH